MASKFAWTPQRLDQLHGMLLTHTLTQMAEELGTTKGTVSGKLGRLGWSANKFSPHPIDVTQPNPAIVRPVIVQPVITESVVVTPIIKPMQRLGEFTLLELRSDQCQWPMNDPPRMGTHLFCGDRKIVGTPYCGAHARMAYGYLNGNGGGTKPPYRAEYTPK